MSDIGTAFLKNIDMNNQKCEFGIFIGEDSARGKGIGSEATKILLKKAFDEYGFNRVYLSVFSRNTRAVRAYLKAGFLVEGVLKEDFKEPEGYADITLMGITKKHWDEIN